MMKGIATKKALLTLMSAICGVGSFAIDQLYKDKAINEAAEKAAKIVMEQLNNK